MLYWYGYKNLWNEESFSTFLYAVGIILFFLKLLERFADSVGIRNRVRQSLEEIKGKDRDTLHPKFDTKLINIWRYIPYG